MTENESFILMGFLRKLIQTRIHFKDPVAEKKINEAFSAQPSASYLLVQRAIFLEAELEKTQRNLVEICKQVNAPMPENSKEMFLRESMDHWGENRENERFAHDARAVAKEKKFLSFEDKGILFLMRNSAKLWVVVILFWVIAYFIKSQ